MVAQVKTYTVQAEKRDGWWLLTSADAPGAVSQVRSLGQAETHAREAIAFVMDVDQADVDVKVVPSLSDELAKKVRAAKESNRKMEDLQRATAEMSREAVAELLAAGFKGTEVAVVLEVSPQRVSQLARPRVAAGRKPRSAGQVTVKPSRLASLGQS